MRLKKYRQHWHLELKRPNINAKNPAFAMRGFFVSIFSISFTKKFLPYPLNYKKNQKNIYLFAKP